jgi:hypothetical protein
VRSSLNARLAWARTQAWARLDELGVALTSAAVRSREPAAKIIMGAND